jgi:hypothetical protein
MLLVTETGSLDRGSTSTVTCPFYKIFVSPKYLSASYRIITKPFLNLLAGIRSALPHLDTKLDCITVLEIILHFCDAVTKHQNHMYSP